MRVISLLRRAHRWTGLTLALVVAAVAISGGLLLGRDPYLRYRHPVLGAPLDPDDFARRGELLRIVHERVAPDGVRVVRFPRAGLNAFHVWLDDGSQVLAHPRTGEVIDRWRPLERLPAFLFELHAHLLVGRAGTVANGVAGLGVVFLGLSGIRLWWRNRRAYPAVHAFPRRAGWRDLLRSHVVAGVVTAVPVLLFTATGVGMAFHPSVAGALSATFDSAPTRQPDAVVPAANRPRQPWTAVLASVQATFPRGAVAMYTRSQPPNAVLVFRVRNPGEWHPNGRSYVLVNPYDASVVQAIDATRQGVGTRAAHAIYPLHAARAGGPAFVVLAAVAAGGLAWLAVGGTAAFLRRPRGGRQRARVPASPPRLARTSAIGTRALSRGAPTD